MLIKKPALTDPEAATFHDKVAAARPELVTHKAISQRDLT